MVNAGLKVTRIFVLNPRSPFHEFVDDDMAKEKSDDPVASMKGESITSQHSQTNETVTFGVLKERPEKTTEKIKLDAEADVFRLTKENIQVLFKQVSYGIRVYICFDHDLKASDGTKFGLNRQDFGVYPGFAVSFFGKPLRIGGRSLLMAFDQEIIADFDEHYENILEKIKNQDCKKLDETLTSDMAQFGSQHFANNVDKRLDALEAFLIEHFESLSVFIKSVRGSIRQPPAADLGASQEK